MSELFRQIGKGRITKEILQRLLRGEQKSDYLMAQQILGSDFISPDEMLSQNFSEAQLQIFRQTLPYKDELVWLKRNNYILLPSPNYRYNLCGLIDNFLGDVEIYAEVKNRGGIVEFGWQKLRKEALPDSIGSSWKSWKLHPLEDIPNIAEVVWGFTTYTRIRKTNPFHLRRKLRLRTSSTDRDNGNHIVFFFGEGGCPIVQSEPDILEKNHLGVAVRRSYIDFEL